jgi:hypothetical protein
LLLLRRAGDDAVAAVALGAIERLVGALEDRRSVRIFPADGGRQAAIPDQF